MRCLALAPKILWNVDKKVTTTRICLDPKNKIPCHVKLLKQNIRISYFSRAFVLKAWFENKQSVLLQILQVILTHLQSRTPALEMERG